MIRNLKIFGLVLLMACALGSCSKDGSDAGILSRIPADCNLAVVVNTSKFVESAGGTFAGDSIIFPDDAVKLGLKSENKYANSGLDLSRMAGWVSSDGKSDFYHVFAVKDESQLAGFLKKKGFEKQTESGSYELYRRAEYVDDNIYSNCAVGNGYAYFYTAELNASTAAATFDGAAANTIADTEFGKYMSDGNAGGLMFDFKALTKELSMVGNDMPDFRVCGKLDLGEDDAELDLVAFDGDGKKFKLDKSALKFDASATVSKDALAYMSANECIVYAVALKSVDWDAVVDQAASQMPLNITQRMMMGMAKEYLKKIDGTVAFGFGFDGGVKDIVSMGDGSTTLEFFPATVVVETVSGQSKGILGDLHAALGTFGMRTINLGDGFSAALPDKAGVIYVKEENNMIILSTRPIEKYGNNKAAELSDMSDALAGGAIYLPADYPIMKDFGISDDVLLYGKSDMKDSESEFKLKITGATKGAIVARALRVALLFKEGVEKIQYEVERDSDFTPFDE